MAQPNQIPTGVKYALGAVALYFLFKGLKLASFAKNVVVNFKKFRLSGTFLQPQIFATFEVMNPVSFPSNIQAITGNVVYQNTPVANVFFAGDIALPAYGKTDIEVQLSSSIGDLFALIQGAMSGQYRNQLFFIGTITVNNFALPLNINVA